MGAVNSSNSPVSSSSVPEAVQSSQAKGVKGRSGEISNSQKIIESGIKPSEKPLSDIKATPLKIGAHRKITDVATSTLPKANPAKAFGQHRSANIQEKATTAPANSTKSDKKKSDPAVEEAKLYYDESGKLKTLNDKDALARLSRFEAKMENLFKKNDNLRDKDFETFLHDVKASNPKPRTAQDFKNCMTKNESSTNEKLLLFIEGSWQHSISEKTSALKIRTPFRT